MSSVEVTCKCGWFIQSDDPTAISIASKEHDKTCPALFKPDVTKTHACSPTCDEVMTEFEKALNAYAFHMRYEIGYPAGDATLMILGFAAGWEAHTNGKFDLTAMPAYPAVEPKP